MCHPSVLVLEFWISIAPEVVIASTIGHVTNTIYSNELQHAPGCYIVVLNGGEEFKNGMSKLPEAVDNLVPRI